MSLKGNPLSVNYGAGGSIIPMVSLLDTINNQALSVALAADCFIPKVKMELSEQNIRFYFSNIGINDVYPVKIKLVFYTHPSDYRAAIKAYSSDFPEWFKSILPRNISYEGNFWYHHIMNHPEYEELRSQNVNAIWSAFYFEAIGQFLPNKNEGNEWYPYTYHKTWSRQKYAGTAPIKKKMSYRQINDFTKDLKSHSIGNYVYFNFNEYGGESVKPEVYKRRLSTVFDNSIVKNKQGESINTWENAFAMNPDPNRPFGEHLKKQILLHLDSLPEIAGFCIDQIQHESGIDYNPIYVDSLTMIQNRPVYHLGLAMNDMMKIICDESHKRGKQVFINNSWKIHSMKDVDGFMYEFLQPRLLSYIAPFRYAAGWHHLKDYYNTDDLIQFEANLKRRLKYGMFSHMVADTFKICQQQPDPEAASLLTIMSYLSDKLRGKEMVLDANCIAVTGANEVNLFKNHKNEYIIPVISRINFLSRRVNTVESVNILLKTKDAQKIKWAYVYSDNKEPYQAKIIKRDSMYMVINIDKHYSSSVIVAGFGDERELEKLPNYIKSKQNLFSRSLQIKDKKIKYEFSNIISAQLRIKGQYVDDGVEKEKERVQVWVKELFLGKLKDNNKPGFQGLIQRLSDVQTFDLPVDNLNDPISLKQDEEESWYVPERMELWVKYFDGKEEMIKSWIPEKGCLNQSVINTNLIYPTMEFLLN